MNERKRKTFAEFFHVKEPKFGIVGIVFCIFFGFAFPIFVNTIVYIIGHFIMKSY